METPQNPSSTGAPSLAPLVAPVISVSSPASGLAGTTVTLTGSGFTNVTAVTFGGVAAQSYVVNSSTKITAVAPPGAGSVQIVVTTTGGTSNGVGFVYTTATPVITSLAPGQGPVAGGNTVTLTGTGFTGATAVRFGATSVPFAVVSATQATAIAPPGVLGTVNVTITAPGGTSAGVLYFYVSAGTLTSVAPNQGPLSGGNTVLLTGTGFTGVTEVDFGGRPASSFTVVSSTQITAIVPAGPAGAAAVAVITTGGPTSGDVFYYYLPVPVLTARTPAAGPTAGGNTVVLTGSGLATATSVRFGAVNASFTVVSDTQITAVAPPGAVGSVTITVTTPGGVSNGVAYAYRPVPVLTAVAPNASGADTIVTLTGSGLTSAAQVLFGAVPAGFAAVSDTTLTAVVPSAPAGTVTVTVVTAGGTSNGVPFTLVLPPQI